MHFTHLLLIAIISSAKFSASFNSWLHHNRWHVQMRAHRHSHPSTHTYTHPRGQSVYKTHTQEEAHSRTSTRNAHTPSQAERAQEVHLHTRRSTFAHKHTRTHTLAGRACTRSTFAHKKKHIYTQAHTHTLSQAERAREEVRLSQRLSPQVCVSVFVCACLYLGGGWWGCEWGVCVCVQREMFKSSTLTIASKRWRSHEMA